MELLIRNLSIGYDFSLCENINLALNVDEIHVLIGNNGEGKTTFLKTLCGIVPSLNGSIKLPNQHIGFVGTIRPDVEYLTVKEYWQFGIKNPDYDLEQQLCLEFKVSELYLSSIKKLSDGQFKKVSLIRQLLKKPSVLLLDEPTAYLDLDNKTFLGNFIQKNKNQFVVVLSTHDLDFAKKYGTNFLLLKDKKIQKVDIAML